MMFAAPTVPSVQDGDGMSRGVDLNIESSFAEATEGRHRTSNIERRTPNAEYMLIIEPPLVLVWAGLR